MEKTTNREMYQSLLELLDMGQWKDRRHLKTCVNMLIGLIISSTVSLTAWIPYAFGRHKISQSVQRRYIRWLENMDIHIDKLYSPLIQKALSEWGDNIIYLAIDTSMLWNTYCIIRISIVYRGRAIPLAWDVKKHGSSAIAFKIYKNVIYNAYYILKSFDKRIILLADRGFADIKLIKLCKELKWGFRIRIKGNFKIYSEKGKSYYAHALCPIRRGNAVFMYNVMITNERYGSVHLALAYDRKSKEKWYIVSSDIANIYTFEEYGFRFDIEENFLDDKSNGFQLESSLIRTEEALKRLCFIISIATLYLIAQGSEIVQKGKRRLIDPHWFRGHSYLRIGWDWVRATLAKGGGFLSGIYLYGGPDPEPAKSSKKQGEIRKRRFADFECNVLILE